MTIKWKKNWNIHIELSLFNIVVVRSIKSGITTTVLWCLCMTQIHSSFLFTLLLADSGTTQKTSLGVVGATIKSLFPLLKCCCLKSIYTFLIVTWDTFYYVYVQRRSLPYNVQSKECITQKLYVMRSFFHCASNLFFSQS